ncbi:hypothetical protein O3G_MSEX001642 [Manduca sexta]|uniref:CNH domain-containing protein n=1 Tax=Manduca sexta TaxID=7130 RepID=A0A921YKU8_MANSE|nr:hypothetical protein O3G_MSEX001642 [Manduca sexta]
MHEAYEVSHLLNATVQIEAIAAYDNNLLLGTRQGHLLMYSLSVNNGNQKYEVQLLRYRKNFSKKPIQQIEVIPDENLLICLTDSIVATYSTNGVNFPLVKTFDQTKGASLFALDNKASDGKPKELFPTSSSKSLEPTIAKYSEPSFLLGRDQTSVLVEESENIVIKKTIKWTEAPIAVVWDQPFVLGLLQDQIVVQTVEPALFIQTLVDLNKARLMYRCKRGLIFVASVGQVWCLSSVDVTKQRQQLLKDKQFQIAIDLTSLADCTPEEKKQKIHSIQVLYALELFDNKSYSQAMKEFIKLNTDPADVIKLFPELDNKADSDTKKNKLKGKDLENALNALIEYLVELRSRIGKGTNSEASGSQEGAASQRNVTQQLELIDTTLLKCYLQTNDALVAPLLRLNNCRLEETEKTLLQHGKHSELIILYQTKGQHTKALQLLRDQAKQPDSSLEGYRETKKYLQHLGAEHINLIFKFSDWILKENPEEGLKIFTEDIEVENFPRPKILDFLLREHEALAIPYLEHMIYTWNDTNPFFHDALINMYRDKIINKKANITEEELQHTKSKLLAFLEKSTHYTPERVLLHFPTDSLFEERAIIFGKLGRHEHALAIYVLILGEVERAIQYCENVSKVPDEQNQDIYVILMRILMNPERSGVLTGPLANAPRHPKTSVPDLETALNILEKHANHISPLKALEVLPNSVPLSRLKHFLESALDGQLTQKRRMQILKGLLYAEHIQLQDLKQYHESKSVVINDCDVCLECKKRFSNQSAFVRYPNGDIVHYSCRIDK